MTDYPKDPFILVSWVNMKLRDFYPSMESLCEDLEIDVKEIDRILREAGFTYDGVSNRYW